MIDLRLLTNAAYARLQTVANADTYLGEPDPVVDQDGYPAPYAFMIPTGGALTGTDEDLGDTYTDQTWGVSITCAGAYVPDVTALASRVDAAFLRWAPVVTGGVAGVLKPPIGYQPTVLFSKDVTPHRPYMVLQYVTTITATN